MSWVTAAGLLMALLVAFVGRWTWLGKEIASERAVLEQLQSTRQDHAGLRGCTMATLMATFQMISQAAQGEITATTAGYSSSEGLWLTGRGSSPGRIRAFLNTAGITENALSLSARDGGFLFDLKGGIECHP